VRSTAARAAGRLGAAAAATEAILARIAELLRDTDPNVRFAAARAVEELGAAAASETFLARIAELLRDTNEYVRSVAAEAVGRLGPTAASETTLSRLAVLVSDSEQRVRSAAVNAVARLANSAVGLQSEQLKALALRCQAKLRALSRTTDLRTAIETLELLEEMQGQEYRLFKSHWRSRCRAISVRELSE
jgi:HEAT repeat protein